VAAGGRGFQGNWDFDVASLPQMGRCVRRGTLMPQLKGDDPLGKTRVPAAMSSTRAGFVLMVNDVVGKLAAGRRGGRKFTQYQPTSMMTPPSMRVERCCLGHLLTLKQSWC